MGDGARVLVQAAGVLGAGVVEQPADAASAPSPRPIDAAAERTATDGGAAYWRDGAGQWRYSGGGDPVPGAQDLRLRDLFDPPAGVVHDEAGEARSVRLVPRAWARRTPGHPLTWVYDYAVLGGRDDIAVPAEVWEERAGQVVAMAAPELHPHNLHGVDAVADLLGVTPSAVRSYLARGQIPEPLMRVGGSPLWSRPIIERWLPTRRRHAAAHRSSGPEGRATDD